MYRIFTACLIVLSNLCSQNRVRAADDSSDNARREAAIAEFTRKTKAANYPALFDQAAAEFNVPADVLKGIAFAETRWEHLTWPPGETISPENGMPRPFGIMSLWDNNYFGHSLIEAARLINQDPEILKADPLQNIRGAAALLRKIYDENPKPPDTTDQDVESWRYAIRKYCGIPEPDLNAQHALNVYVFMSQGYHQYGIEWDARPVNLEPIRSETARIIAEERARRGLSTPTNASGPIARPPEVPAQLSNSTVFGSHSGTNNETVAIATPAKTSWIWRLCAIALLLLLVWYVFGRRRRQPDPDQPPG